MSDTLVGALVGLLPLAVLGLRKLAARTKTKVDDRIVEFVDANLPWVRKQVEDRLKDESEKPKPPRPQVVDHRKPR